VNWTRRTFFEK